MAAPTAEAELNRKRTNNKINEQFASKLKYTRCGSLVFGFLVGAGAGSGMVWQCMYVGSHSQVNE